MKLEKVLFTLTPHGSAYQIWYFPLKRIFKEMVLLDTHWNKIMYGKKVMNEKFLKVIEEEKPDCVFMCFGSDEFELDVLKQIKIISPKTRTLVGFGDDDMEFEKYSRYLMLFVDYGILIQKEYLKRYKKDGINNVFYVFGVDNKFYKPLNLKKKYDVTFIGSPITKESGRYNLIKFLKEAGINLRLFGTGWEKYSEFKEIYGGIIPSKELVKVLNQSKINLCFSKSSEGKPTIKAKFIEGSACKTFVLTEYWKGYIELFKEGKEMIMFKGEKDLLEKINYYLKNEKEREKITNSAYKKVIKNHNIDLILKNIFKEISKREKNISPNQIDLSKHTEEHDGFKLIDFEEARQEMIIK